MLLGRFVRRPGPAPGQARDAPASACRKECGGSAGTLDDGVVGNSGIAEETRRRSHHSFRVGQSDCDPVNQALPSARANTASQQVEIPDMYPSNDQNFMQSRSVTIKTPSQERIIFARHDLVRKFSLAAFRPWNRIFLPVRQERTPPRLFNLRDRPARDVIGMNMTGSKSTWVKLSGPLSVIRSFEITPGIRIGCPDDILCLQLPFLIFAGHDRDRQTVRRVV